MSSSVIFEGSFTTKVATTDTKVNFKIYNTYEMNATFTSRGKKYTFKMMSWKKTKEETKKTMSSFDKFSQLILERFGYESDKFGTIETTDSTKTIIVNAEQRINILKYACVDVFICAEEIILSHRHSLLDYCVFHRARGVADTYEKYIHLIACCCLINSEFLVPSAKFPEVEFFSIDSDYINEKLAKIKSKEEKPDSDDEL